MKANNNRRKLGTIRHEVSGIEVPFYGEGTRFVCDVLEKTFTAPDAAVLRKQVLDFVDHWVVLEWHPVVKVEVETAGRWGGGDDAYLKLDYERFYVSVGPAGGTAKVDWEVDPDHRRAKARWSNESEWKLVDWPLQAPMKSGRDEWIMPYSEETWQALEAIKDGVEKMGRALTDLVSTRAGVERLKAGGAKTLAIGSGGGK